MKNLQEEVWKYIPGYENIYQVSNKGRIKSLNYRGKKSTEHLLIQKYEKNRGYYRIALCKNGVVKYFRVHRLVAFTFIPNPENLPQVNHLDEDGTNNCVENLCWCSAKDNCNWGTRNIRISNKKKR